MHYPGPGASCNGLIFYWVDGTLGADGADLGVRMNALVSEAWGWTGAGRRIGRSTEWYCVGVGSGVRHDSTCIDKGRSGWTHCLMDWQRDWIAAS